MGNINTTLIDILSRFEEHVEEFELLITSITYFVGLVFAVKSLFLLKQYGELRTSAGQASLRKPLVNFLIAVVLLYSPGVLHAFIRTIYADPSGSLVSYDKEPETEFEAVVVMSSRVIQLIGYIAFLRGWVLLARVGEQGAQPGALARSFMHIIGGVLAINIIGTFRVLNSILGL